MSVCEKLKTAGVVKECRKFEKASVATEDSATGVLAGMAANSVVEVTHLEWKGEFDQAKWDKMMSGKTGFWGSRKAKVIVNGGKDAKVPPEIEKKIKDVDVGRD